MADDTTAGGTGQDTTQGSQGQDTTKGAGGQDTTGGSTDKSKWPDNWRVNLASGDEKVLQRLQRFASPEDVWKSYRSIEQKISTGELKPATPFPEKGTTDQQNQWRKDHGIPEKPEAYDLNLGNGLVIGEEDKPVVEDFLKFAHARNMSPDAVKHAVSWYFGEYATKQEQQATEAYNNKKKATEDELRAEWGGNYRGNRQAIDNLLAGKIPTDSDLHKLVSKAVDSNAEFAKFLASLALDINPASTLVSAEGADQAKTVDDEITKIETFMRTNRLAYNKDDKMQARLRQLYDARERMKSRKAA